VGTQVLQCKFTFTLATSSLTILRYWDWVKDSAAPASSPVWSTATGFGGNGVDTTVWLQRCINGPLASLRPAYLSGEYRPHCVNRNFAPGYPEGGQQEMVGFNYDQSILNSVNANTRYNTFHPALEQGPHAAVHYGVSQRDADMSPFTSPNGKLIIPPLSKLEDQESSKTTTY
jgi:hypothetical protein